VRVFIRTTLAWLVVAFLGETIIAPAIDIMGIAPDFTVIAIVILALAEGSTAGVLGGFFVGLIQDLSVPNLLGLHALCKTLLGGSVGRLHGRLVYGMPVIEGALVFLASFAHDTLFLLVQSSMSSDAFLLPLLTQALPTAVYTALAGVPLIRLADLLGILRRED
jgi:rod shape-determining protein MreD